MRTMIEWDPDVIIYVNSQAELKALLCEELK